MRFLMMFLTLACPCSALSNLSATPCGASFFGESQGYEH
jgi:hypothetical protein